MTAHPAVLVAFHESAHVTAAYMLGREVEIVTAHGSPRTESGRTFADIRSRTDAEDEVVVLLSGSASIEELGIRSVGGGHDERLAGEIAVYATRTVEEAVALFDRARDRMRSLVRSARFQNLTIALAVELAETPAVSGRRAQELLASWDPAPVASGVRGATLAEFASWHSSPWATAKLAAMRPPRSGG